MIPEPWLCKFCAAPVETNPKLYMSLAADGTWVIEGVNDIDAAIACTEGHDQNDQILEKSLSAFLEETFPHGTWQGSDPKWRDDE